MTYATNQSTGDTQHNVRDAALHGATLAFSKPAAKPKPLVNTYTGEGNGALLAATKVGSPRNNAGAAGSSAPLTRDWTGSRSVTSQSAVQPGSKSTNSHKLGVPEEHPVRNSSPSNIAARLAAARHSPLRPTPAPTPQAATITPIMSERHTHDRDVLPPSGSVGSVLARLDTKKPSPQPRKRRDSFDSRSVTASKQDRPTDDTPIPPTNSLVKMFEQTRSDTPTKSDAAVPLSYSQHSPPPVRSPKPQRTFKLPPEPIEHGALSRQRTRTPPPVKPKPKHQIELPPPQYTDGAPYFQTPQKDPMKSPPIKQKPAKLTTSRTTTPPPPKPPPQRGSRQARPQSEDMKRSAVTRRRPSTSMGSEQTPDSPSSFKSAKEMQEEDEKLKPTLPPPRRSQTRKPDGAAGGSRPRSAAPVPTARRQDQKQNPMHSPTQFSPPRRPTSVSGTSPGSVYHNNYQRDSVKQITQHMTGESLSSAIMGAALASSRNASPAPSQPMTIEPLFPPRKHHHHHSPFHHRSPSPQKQSPPKVAGKLRTTMRKEPSSSEDEDEVRRYKKKGTRIMGIKSRKHPNKHHEGTRNRWRDEITERERKRYEGVWAANKGLHIPPLSSQTEDDPSQDVLNYAVQDIWTRSRLPVHVLEEVWDLVDSRAIGRLKREEFVVGLWLIDQRLKGRKLPIRVSDSLWASARGMGLNVKVRR
ncbi:hypothetical protein HBH49_144060 [Parastagonospora nodorum]|nr:hypothetical protein HBH49_144060 [Parastagonospora nodorum]